MSRAQNQRVQIPRASEDEDSSIKLNTLYIIFIE